MPEHFVIVSEHDPIREFLPFAQGALARYTPGRFRSSVTYGPYTDRGAERVARRALSQVAEPGDWRKFEASGKRYARDEHGIRMVDVFARPTGTYRSARRNMPKDV